MLRLFILRHLVISNANNKISHHQCVIQRGQIIKTNMPKMPLK